MFHVHLNIGSNLGDREDNIRRAVAMVLRLASDIESVRVSGPIYSEPWGFDSTNEFVNIGVSFDTTVLPELLLDATQHIERAISGASHRDATGRYIDRVIDIDIIATADNSSGKYELVRINNSQLTLPHPRALQRDFVTIPLRQIDPELYNMMMADNNCSNNRCN